MLIAKAAWKQDTGARFTMDAAIAKLFARRNVQLRDTTKPSRFMAATATAASTPVDHYRDARITRNLRSTSEIQRRLSLRGLKS